MKSFVSLIIASGLVAANATGAEVQGLVFPFKQVSVSAPVLQEVITNVMVEEGDVVKENQILVQLRAERETLEVERTKKLIELADFKARGAEALYKDKMSSKEKALEELANLDLAKIMHRAAEVALSERSVRAPLDGTVVKKHKESGESVERAEKLVDIVNIDQIYVQFYLDPALMRTVKEGLEMKVRFPVIDNAEFLGKIAFVDPRIDAGSGLFKVKVLIDNPDHKIKAGMRASADFAKL